MNRPEQKPSTNVDLNVTPVHKRTTLLFRRIRSIVDSVSGRSLTYDELALLINEPRSNLGRWINGDGEPSSEALLRMLELVPENQRHEIMDRPPACRLWPKIDHPWLAHDPVSKSVLRSIVVSPTGFTVVQGEQASLVTFIVTALGHSALTLSEGTRQVVGLDVYRPDWFVPVPGVIHLNNQLRADKIREEFERFLPNTVKLERALVVLNGVFPGCFDALERIAGIACRNHVVLAARPPVRGQQAQPLPRPTNLILVNPDRYHGERLTLEIKAG
jgi:hypothetical protein